MRRRLTPTVLRLGFAVALVAVSAGVLAWRQYERIEAVREWQGALRGGESEEDGLVEGRVRPGQPDDAMRWRMAST